MSEPSVETPPVTVINKPTTPSENKDHRQIAQKVSFTDAKSIERTTHPLGAEIVITDEIETAARDHFQYVHQTIDAIEVSLNEIDNEWKNPELIHTEYDPLTEEFLQELLNKAQAQIPEITDERITTEIQHVIEKHFGLFKQEKEIPVKVIKRVLKNSPETHLDYQGLNTLKSNNKIFKYGEPVENAIAREKEYLLNVLESWLLGNGIPWNPAVRGSSLPLLATRLFKDGRPIEHLDVSILQQLVPEIAPVLERIDKFRDELKYQIINDRFREIGMKLHSIFPDKDIVTALLYSDDDIETIVNLYEKVCAESNKTGCTGGFDFKQGSDRDLKKNIYDTIEHFFDDKVSGDTVVFHGTPAIPRIIDSGELLPPQKMTREGRDFSFFTRREGGIGIEGARGVHWAGLPGSAYVTNKYQNLNGYFSEKEKKKGDLAGGFVAVRVGDALQLAPYIENEEISSEEARNKYGRVATKSITVELTDLGYAKVANRLQRFINSRDIVFASSASDDSDELFDYSFPVKDLFFSTVKDDSAMVIEHLKKAGWTDNEIELKLTIMPTNSFDAFVIEQKRIATLALERPKYPKTFVAGLRKTHLSATKRV